MTFPIHLDTLMRMCNAQTVALLAQGTNVKINNLTPAVVSDVDNHNMLGQLINVLSHNVNIGGMTAIPSIISMASPDALGLIVHPGGLPIPIQGSPNVFVGQGTGAAGIGMMAPILNQFQQIIGWNALQIGEFVAMAGQIVGIVQNFTQIGGGAAVAQISNLQGMPLSPGSTVIGLTSGSPFTFGNYFDSRTYNNVPGGASYSSANSYPDITTYTATANVIIDDVGTNYDYILSPDYAEGYVMDDGEILISDYVDLTSSIIVIDDYTIIGGNLTSSTIVVDAMINTEVDYYYLFADSNDIIVTDDGSLIALG